MNPESNSQVQDGFKKYTPRRDPPAKVESSFYAPILKEVQQLPQPKIVKDWNILQDFEHEMNELPSKLIQEWISGTKFFIKKLLENCLKVGYYSQHGKSMYQSILNGLAYWLEKFYTNFSMSFQPRFGIDFGIQDPEVDESISKEEIEGNVEDDEDSEYEEEENLERCEEEDPPRITPKDKCDYDFWRFGLNFEINFHGSLLRTCSQIYG